MLILRESPAAITLTGTGPEIMGVLMSEASIKRLLWTAQECLAVAQLRDDPAGVARCEAMIARRRAQLAELTWTAEQQRAGRETPMLAAAE